MKLMLQKCRQSTFWAILFVSITCSGIQTASALGVGDFVLPVLCGPIHTPPFNINVGNTYRTIVTSATVSVFE